MTNPTKIEALFRVMRPDWSETTYPRADLALRSGATFSIGLTELEHFLSWHDAQIKAVRRGMREACEKIATAEMGKANKRSVAAKLGSPECYQANSAYHAAAAIRDAIAALPVEDDPPAAERAREGV